MRGIPGMGVVAMRQLPAGADAPSQGFCAEECGPTQRQLVQSIKQVEELITKGFQYIAADHNTVHAGMKADKAMPGLSEADFIDKYGFGVATMSAGLPPPLTTGRQQLFSRRVR
jgi:hypothetical protein